MINREAPTIKILIADVPESLLMNKHERAPGMHFVSSLDEARQKLTGETFDLVFCSWHFDGCRMLELLNSLRQYKDSRMSVICFREGPTDLTTEMEFAIARTAHLLGADCYLAPTSHSSSGDVLDTIGHYITESGAAEPKKLGH